MRRRLIALLVTATLAGTVAGAVGSATAGKDAIAPPRALRSAPQAVFYGPCPLPARFRRAFDRAANDTGLPLAMLTAVATIESNLDEKARSSAGARGLLQVLPSTAATLDLDPDEPASNILAGARYLRQMLDRFQSTDLALAAYNAGPTAVAAAGGAPSTITLAYVEQVTRLWRALAGCR